MPEREKKFGVAEALIVTLFIFVMGLLDAVPFVGPILNFAFTQLYLYMKGVSGTYQMMMLGSNTVTEVISGVPGLGWIGDFTDILVYWLTVFDDWFAPEEVKEKLEEAGQLAQGGEGGKAPMGEAAGVGAGAEMGAGAGKMEGAEGGIEASNPQEGPALEEGAVEENGHATGQEAPQESEEPGAESGQEEGGDEGEQNDLLESPEERNPMENLGESLNMPDGNFSQEDNGNEGFEGENEDGDDKK